LIASGADFGVVEVRHGLMQQETTVILYTDLKSQRFHFVPEVMDGVEGAVDFRVGRDQIWIRTDRPVRFQVKKLTSRQRDPLLVKVDVFERQGRYELNILVPLAMEVVRLATVVDTASLMRSEEPELPAMSMVGPIFEGLEPVQSSERPSETLAQALAQQLRATLGPDYRVTLGEPKRTRTSGGIASLIERILGRKAQQPIPGVHEDGHGGYTIEAASMADAAQKLRELNATLEPGEMLIPRGPLAAALQEAAGTQSSDGSAQDEAMFARLLRAMSPSHLKALEQEDCDTCVRRGHCPVEPLMRESRRVLGITPKSRRRGVTSDPWSAIGSMFNYPSSPSRRDVQRQEHVCASCPHVSCSSHPANPARRRREAEAQQANPVTAENPVEPQAPQSEPAAASSDAGNESAQDQAEVVGTGVEAQAEAPSSGGNGSAS